MSWKDIWWIVKLHVLKAQHSLSTVGYPVPSPTIINQPKDFVIREVYHMVIINRIRVKKITTRLDDNVRLYSGGAL
jgi:hypothetical protein